MTDMVPFDYARLPAEHAGEVRAAAERIKVRLKRTAEDIIEIGRDLIAMKERLAHGQFLPWIEAEFGMTDRTARNFMAVAERFGSKSETVSDFSPKALYLLASAPADVVQEVETRAAAGEIVSAAEIARLTALHKAEQKRLAQEIAAANAETNAVRRDLEALQQKSAEKAAKASRREANLIEDKNRALADKEKAEARIAEEARRAHEAAWAEASGKYEALIQSANQEAAEAKRLAEEKTAALAVAIAQARTEAEQAAHEQAELLAAQALETRRKELDKLSSALAKAEARVANAARTEQVLQDEIRKHEEYLARLQQEDVAAREQTEMAERLAKVLNDEMLALTMLEAEAQPAALRHLARAGQMCRHMAQALDAFMAPRLAA